MPNKYDSCDSECVFIWQSMFPFLCLIFALFTDCLSSYIAKISPLKVSMTVYIIVVAFVSTLVLNIMCGDEYATYILNTRTWIHFSPHTIMYAVLPILIFEGAFKIDSHAFNHHLNMILFLAVVIFMCAALLTGGSMYVLQYAILHKAHWNIYTCLIFGTIISATDPVAVLSLLHEVGAPHDLSLMIEGESLLNDGVAIVMYKVFMLFAKVNAEVALDADMGYSIGMILLGVVGSLLLGKAAAECCGYCLTFAVHNSTRERAIIISTVYATYMGCELMNGSGVLGLVVLGINFDRHKEKLSEGGTNDNLQLWGFFAYWANAIIFLMTGCACAQFIWRYRDANDQSFVGVVVYLIIMVVRLVVLIPCYYCSRLPCFHRLKFQYMVMMWWGGLRGAVALLLALQLEEATFLDRKQVREATVDYVSLCVFLSLSLQAMISPLVVKKMRLDTVSKYRKRVMEDFVKDVKKSVPDRITSIIDSCSYLRETNWTVFKNKVTITNPYRKVAQKSSHALQPGQGSDPNLVSSQEAPSDTQMSQAKHDMASGSQDLQSTASEDELYHRWDPKRSSY